MIRIYAKPGHCLYEPGGKQAGAPPRYFGRRIKVERDQAGTVLGITNRASKEATEIDEASPAQAARVKRLVDRCRGDTKDPDGAPVWAADAESARALGIPYVDVEYDDDTGEWWPATKKPKFSGETTKSSKKGAEL